MHLIGNQAGSDSEEGAGAGATEQAVELAFVTGISSFTKRRAPSLNTIPKEFREFLLPTIKYGGG